MQGTSYATKTTISSIKRVGEFPCPGSRRGVHWFKGVEIALEDGRTILIRLTKHWCERGNWHITVPVNSYDFDKFSGAELYKISSCPGMEEIPLEDLGTIVLRQRSYVDIYTSKGWLRLGCDKDYYAFEHDIEITCKKKDSTTPFSRFLGKLFGRGKNKED